MSGISKIDNMSGTYIGLTKDDVDIKKDVTKSVTKEEAKEKKEVSLREIDDKFMTIDDFLDNFS